ncbi:nucleoprotein [University of Helsinki virus 1]|uniref:Nucleoprotein n=1 Tax=University of Helsinki virus TaxID=1382279 RepID=S5WZV1_9VIRU|nr:nucleoprotein [University of Helsinki virus]AGS94416.1 nucleoprotein [University of Helsinki virus 1]
MAALQRAAVSQLAIKKKLNKILTPFQGDVNQQIFVDIKALRMGLDSKKINDVLRRLRKETKGSSDLQKLRDLNEDVAGMSGMVAKQTTVEVDSTMLTDDEIMLCVENIEMIKKKAEYKGGLRPKLSGFELETGMSSEDHAKFNKLFSRFVPKREDTRGSVSKPRSWVGINPKDLANQFGTSPAVTITLMMMRTNSPFKDILEALNDIAILDSGMFVNSAVIKAMAISHTCLDCIEFSVPKNSSGYNITVKSVVKAANAISGLPKLEKIVLDDENRVKVLQSLLEVQKEFKIKIVIDEERSLFEDLFYKVCVSPNGPCVISVRSELTGRGWENTVFRLRRPPPYAPRLYPDLMDLDMDVVPPLKLSLESDSSSNEMDEYIKSTKKEDTMEMEVIDPRMPHLLKVCEKIFQNKKPVFVDIEGPPRDPVEIAFLNTDTSEYIHIFRMPKDKDDFKKSSKHCHGLLLDDMSNHPDLQPDKSIEAMFAKIPHDCTILSQGSDIEDCFKFFGRKDITVNDCKWKKEDYNIYHDELLDNYADSLPYVHSGAVKDKKGALIAPHCALLDCMMFSRKYSGKNIKCPGPVEV